MLSISPMMTVITDMFKHICAKVNSSSSPKTSPKLWSSSSIMSAVAKIWRDNKVLIVMGGILTMGHFVWRELQNNTAFVPAGMPPLKRKLAINFYEIWEVRSTCFNLYNKKAYQPVTYRIWEGISLDWDCQAREGSSKRVSICSATSSREMRKHSVEKKPYPDLLLGWNLVWKRKLHTHIFAEKWVTEEWFEKSPNPKKWEEKGQLWSLMPSLPVVSRRKRRERWLLLSGEDLHSAWNEIVDTSWFVKASNIEHQSLANNEPSWPGVGNVRPKPRPALPFCGVQHRLLLGQAGQLRGQVVTTHDHLRRWEVF